MRLWRSVRSVADDYARLISVCRKKARQKAVCRKKGDYGKPGIAVVGVNNNDDDDYYCNFETIIL